MSKLFVFGIGGTGARVLKSLTMLLMAGVKTNVEEIIPIVIDKDETNGDMISTKSIIQNYCNARSVFVKDDNKFFSTKITLLKNIRQKEQLCLSVDYGDKKFSEYIAKNQLNTPNKAFVEALYSKKSLDMDTDKGFRGVPSIGSVVLNQFENTDIFNAFAQRFESGDKIFIISSIFGGTGASGFPLLVNTLRGSSKLNNWDYVRKAPIGAISVLPYFIVGKPNDEEKNKNKVNVDSDTFNSKAKAALAYYGKTLNGNVDCMYYVGDKKKSEYKYCAGGEEQKNPAHLVEFVSALSIVHFANEEIVRAEKTSTSHWQFGFYNNPKHLGQVMFRDFAPSTREIICDPLIRFYAFKRYMDLVFDKEYQHQPWSRNFPWNRDYNIEQEVKTSIKGCLSDFYQWLDDLNNVDFHHHCFSPFSLDAQTFAFINGNADDIAIRDSGFFKNWAWFDNELNKQSSKKQSSSKETRVSEAMKKEQRFLEIFYRTTDEFIKKLIPQSLKTLGNKPEECELLTIKKDVAGTDGGWCESPQFPYGIEENDNPIEESNSESITEPTSIPSPYARMELARIAFDTVANILSQKGKTWEDVPCVYRKIASDCLDVAEIFFNYDSCKDYIRIIKWDSSELQEIIDKLNVTDRNDISYESLKKNAELAKVMKKYLNDGNYNHAIYLLNYIGDNRADTSEGALNIIGATSPITMFFSVDNDLKYVNDKIKFRGKHNPFDGQYMPLEKRDPKFIKWFKVFIREYNESFGNQNRFELDFKSLNKYIQVATRQFTEDIVCDSYEEISCTTGGKVRILGKCIKYIKRSVECSDFYIKTSNAIFPEEKVPLVLPVLGDQWDNLAYTSEYNKWGDNKDKAPLRDNRKLNDRILPGTNIKYPYLTMSDFVEDVIIKMPYKLNSKDFFNGNQQEDSKVSFLLPLTSTFFKYFTVGDLREFIKIKVSGTVVNVKLKIPIKSNINEKVSYIEYEKTYETSKKEILEAKFGLGIFPIVRPVDVKVAHYRVALFDRSEMEANISFYDNLETVNVKHNKVRRAVDVVCGIKTYVIEKSNFDRIEVAVRDIRGYIIPIFVDISTNEAQKKFKFAVDFGTTNTHIAYSIDGGKEKAFDFDSNNPQIVRLHKDYEQNKDIGAAFDDNFVPINNGRFPMRSAFAEAVDINYKYDKYTICDGNIPFVFEKVGPRDYQRIWTGDDLKWSANEDRIKLYIKNLAFIIHNKVLCGKGRLEETEIRWFYPASMPIGMRSDMNDAWNDAYKDFFGENYSNNVISMSESIAPYCYFMNRDGALGRVVTIDIGGGTTDVYISDGQEGNDGYMFSFRCASDAIFGDGYNNNIRNNGFVRKYKNILGEVTSVENSENIEGNMGGTLAEALKNVVKSSELIPFFFSSDNTFLDRLSRDNEFKYVFLIFYSAIIYNVAQTMRAKGIGKPKTVVFSGNGSRTLKVIARGVDIQSDFVKSIFEKVYEEEYNDGEFVFKYDDNPKEATAKGGLNAEDYQIKAKPKSIVLLGIDNETFVKLNNQVDDKNEKMAENVCYDALTTEIKEKVVDNVCRFIEFVPKLNTCNAFGEKYLLDVNILKDVLDICKQNLGDYFDLGVQRALDMLSSDTYRTKDVTESLFFFPIVGMLNNLAQKLYEKYNNNAS